MGSRTQREDEISKVRHDAERLRRAAIKVEDDLAVACLIARALELEALAAMLDARGRRRISFFAAGYGKPKG